MAASIHTARRLRRNMTPPERYFWSHVRSRRFMNLKFRRQVPLGPYVVDFLCEQHRLVVELDGDSHALQVYYDARRDAYLEGLGYWVLRFANRDVMSNPEGVLTAIGLACRK